jgi:hypothetical protein
LRPTTASSFKSGEEGASDDGPSAAELAEAEAKKARAESSARPSRALARLAQAEASRDGVAYP